METKRRKLDDNFLNPIVKENRFLRCKFELDGSTQLSEELLIDDLKWKIAISPTPNNTIEMFLFFLAPLDNRERYVCEVNASGSILRLQNTGNSTKPRVTFDSRIRTFDYDSNNYHNLLNSQTKPRIYPYMSCNLTDLLRSDYVRGTTIHIQFKLKKIKFFDFSRKIDNYSDIVLRAGDVDFYFNKGLLCSGSKYFFNKLQAGILQDPVINLDEFNLSYGKIALFLAAMHNYSIAVTAFNASSFLKIFYIFDCPGLKFRCEELLKSRNLKITVSLLKNIEDYEMENWMVDMLQKTDLQTLSAVAKLPKFKTLLKITQKRVLMHICSLIR
ncbi:unnamed protein product [Caenorhabditis angaria]|uniref:BTB domain-containing protein n=1 Tax=Caenorhabditis angaria TaxID=860376 RepID=A0A9P1I4E4_9PELO|nr:unnamed protein product [Caenorhabditis angaria]